MKISLVALALLSQSSSAFNVVAPISSSSTRQVSSATLTQLGMFSGAGAGKPTEDNPEEQAKIDAAAKAMGMSSDEYMIAMNARKKMVETLDATMVTVGDASTVQIERDVNNPPKTLDITITDAGKALGKDSVSKELVANLKKASDESKTGRQEAQKKMMEYIQQQLK